MGNAGGCKKSTPPERRKAALRKLVRCNILHIWTRRRNTEARLSLVLPKRCQEDLAPRFEALRIRVKRVDSAAGPTVFPTPIA